MSSVSIATTLVQLLLFLLWLFVSLVDIDIGSTSTGYRVVLPGTDVVRYNAVVGMSTSDELVEMYPVGVVGINTEAFVVRVV